MSTCCYQHSNGIGEKELRIIPNPNHSSVSCLFNAGNNILTKSILYVLPDDISLVPGGKSTFFVASFIQAHACMGIFYLVLHQRKNQAKKCKAVIKR